MEGMSTFKRGKVWYVRITDHMGHRRVFRAATEKRTAEHVGRKLAGLVSAVQAGESLPEDLVDWVFRLDSRRRGQLVAWGLVSERHLQASAPLETQIDLWCDSLAARGRSPKYVGMHRLRATAICTAAKFQFFRDINTERVLLVVDQWRRDGAVPGFVRHTTLSEGTITHYLKALRQFTRWMYGADFASRDPLKALPISKRARRSNDSKSNMAKRRALTTDERGRLIIATEGARFRYNMTGGERALVYRVALTTGLRASAIRRLTAGDVQGVWLNASSDQGHKRSTPKPLMDEVAALLADHVAMMTPDAPLFKLPNESNMARMLRADCDEAGIDTEGVDFHCLRHTFGTTLAAQGVHPKNLMSLMDHSTIAMTMQLYTHSMPGDEVAAIKNQPGFETKTEHRKEL